MVFIVLGDYTSDKELHSNACASFQEIVLVKIHQHLLKESTTVTYKQ